MDEVITQLVIVHKYHFKRNSMVIRDPELEKQLLYYIAALSLFILMFSLYAFSN
jgi:lactam utilization protein B